MKGIVFDVDGTLVDTVDLHAHAWHDAFKRFGKDADYIKVREQIGKGGDQILPVFFTEEEIQRFGEELKTWRLEHFKREYLPKAKAFPKTRELFSAVRERGVRIALASSAKEDELESYKMLANIEGLTDAETNADDVKKTKPHPDIFEVAISKLGLEPEEAIAVGDSPFDAEAAGKIRLKTIGVLCGGFPEERLRAAGAVKIYRDPADLLEHIEEITSLNEHINVKERKSMANINPSQQGGKIDNVLYDVVTVLHEKSKGLEAYDKYERDLQGNNQVKQIFDEIRRNDEQAVQRLHECLRQLVGGESGQRERAA